MCFDANDALVLGEHIEDTFHRLRVETRDHDDRGRNSLVEKKVSGIHHRRRNTAHHENHDVKSLADPLNTTQLKSSVKSGHYQFVVLAETKICRTGPLTQRLDRASGLGGVGGSHHGHALQQPRHANVLEPEVSRTGGPVFETTPHSDNPNRQIVHHRPIADEFERTQDGEGNDGITKGCVASLGHTRRYANHVLFSDPHVDEAVREPVAKRLECHETEVSREQHDPLVTLRFLHQSVNKGGPHFTLPVSRIACLYSSSDIGK